MSERAVTVTVIHPVARGRSAGRYLLVIEGGGGGEAASSAMFPLPRAGEVLIGRAPEAHLRLRDPAASRHHARLTLSEHEVRISDLGSHNGTRVGGEPVGTGRVLQAGDVITICDVALIYYAGPAAGEARERPIHEEPGPLMRRLEEEIERALSFHHPVSLAVFDLGRPPDLGALAGALCGQVRLMDVLARSGDRLLALLPDADAAEAAQTAGRVLRALLPLFPSARAGYASCPEDGLEAEALHTAARAAQELCPPGQVLSAADAVQARTIGSRTVVIADPAMLRLYQLIDRLAASDLPVLIHGETGSGKEIAAQALHEGSPRRAGRLVSLNCAAVPESLAEGELFGYEKGAFSGATASKPGLIEVAAGGTLFLDEIGELSPAIQAKLLRVLETRRLVRLGDTRERPIDLRIVAATNRDLEKEAEVGRFRKDLFFRLGAAVLMLPPLRDRPRELPLLARAFLEEACARAGRQPQLLSPAALHRLRAYPWPGNLRELRNLMDFVAATVTEPVLLPEHLPERIAGPARVPAEEAGSLQKMARAVLQMALPDKLQAMEEALISEAMNLARGNKSAAARLLGVHRKVIERRLDRPKADS
jgi:DNA-binding NtrC family response regulator